MAKLIIEDIKIVIADGNRQLRSSLKGVLHHHGFRGIMDAANVETLKEHIRVDNPDLILCDIDLPYEKVNVCQLIDNMRHNKVGMNPFSAVILFIEEASADLVAMASQAGVDDLQVKPVVAQNVIKRVEYLIKQRKPFVVTTDYVGPDRRKSHRAGTMEIPLVDVPNSMAAKANGKFSQREMNLAIQNTWRNVNAQKIERHVFQVSYLVKHLVPDYRAGTINQESIAHLARLRRVSTDIVKRLEDSDFGHIADLAGTLETVAKSLWNSGRSPNKKDLDLLEELSSALNAMFASSADKGQLAAQIKSTVQEKYED